LLKGAFKRDGQGQRDAEGAAGDDSVGAAGRYRRDVAEMAVYLWLRRSVVATGAAIPLDEGCGRTNQAERRIRHNRERRERPV